MVLALASITANPNEIPSVTNLERINQNAIESENEQKFDTQRQLMQKQLQRVISTELGIKITSIYLEKDWNFPFKDASEIKPHLEEHEDYPICNILPNISLHLQNIRKTQMFTMFSEKYQKYPIEIDIADERYYNSTTHYGFAAKLGNKTASTHFHVNSCTGQASEYHYIRRHDSTTEESTNSNYPNEVIVSLQNDEFCLVQLEPWRQELADYSKKISEATKKHLDATIESEDKTTEEVIKIHQELHRLGILNDMVRFAMMGDSEKENLQKEMKEYKQMFGQIPEEFLILIDNSSRN